MGTWGTGLYSDDTTVDVRDEYVRLLKSGQSSEKATKEIIDRFADLINDKQIECLVILPLADTQWKYGILIPSIKERAIKLLSSGGDLEFWEADAPSDVQVRKLVLERLLKKLKSTPPPAKPITVSISKEKPKKVRITAPIGTVFLLPISEKLYLPLVLLAYYELEKSIEPIFCVFPTPIKPGATLPTETFNKYPLALSSGLGPKSVFGAFPDDGRNNPFKQLKNAGVVPDIQLPSVPEFPTFYNFSGMIRCIADAFNAQTDS
jgi:hypothetical protein